MKKLLVVLTFIAVLFISACVEPEVYTIEFDVNGGEDLVDYEYTDGDLLEMPADPTREGYEFIGWYYDKALSENKIILLFFPIINYNSLSKQRIQKNEQ